MAGRTISPGWETGAHAEARPLRCVSGGFSLRQHLSLSVGKFPLSPARSSAVEWPTPKIFPLMRRFRRAVLSLLVPLSGFTAGCAPPSGGEPQDLAQAQALSRGDSLRAWPSPSGSKAVVLYVDRSKSMRGFLDPAYRSRDSTDYRAVIDGFQARLRPARVYGFGNDVLPAGEAGLGVLGNKEFYADGNTEMENVFPLVLADSALSSTHVIIGDGRRTDPNVANDQFVRMRALADAWISHGGTFVVASSRAPFLPVRDDPSGCRADTGADPTCPLYAFAFVAPGEEGRVAPALAAVFQNLFVTPLPAVAGQGVRLEGHGTAVIDLESEWARSPDRTPIARARGKTASNEPLRATLSVRDSTSPLGRTALMALRGRPLHPRLFVRQMADDSTSAPWLPSPSKGALLRGTPDPFAYEFFSRGPDGPRYLYRIQLHPGGAPSWLATFDAESATDAVRTYGLGRLFESFRARDPGENPPVVRLYAVVN